MGGSIGVDNFRIGKKKINFSHNHSFFNFFLVKIYSFARKAQSNGLHLIPVPADPHALPYSLKSDPLRGPVFVALDVECLMDNKSYLFEGIVKL